MTEKKNKSSAIVKALKKGFRSLLSGKKDLDKLAATLAVTAVVAEEVEAAQKSKLDAASLDQAKLKAQSAVKDKVETDASLDPNSASGATDAVNTASTSQSSLKQAETSAASAEEKSASLKANAADAVQQAAHEARMSLRSLLQDELANTQAIAKAYPITPDAARMAMRNVIDDEVKYNVSRAAEDPANNPNQFAKSELPNLPDTSTGSIFSSNSWLAGLGGLGALGGGGGAGGVASIVSTASSIASGGATPLALLSFSGAAIDGYVQGATVDFQIKNAAGVWTTVAQTLTKADGTYNFSTLKPEYAQFQQRIVIEAGGYDANTGQQIGQVVSTASASTTGGYQAATPLTMIMAISGLSEDQFKSQIGLSGVANLGTFDPVSAMTSGNAALGEKVFAVQQTMYTMLQAASAAAGGGVQTAASLNAAIDAVALVLVDNFQAGGATLTVDQVTESAIKSLINVGSISDPTLFAKAFAYQTALINAIEKTNAVIVSNYTGLADALRNPTDPAAQGIVAGAKAAASVSQSLLLNALSSADPTTALTNYVDTSNPAGLAQQVQIQVNAYQQIAELTAANTDLTKTVTNPVFLVNQALGYSGDQPVDTQIKDLAGNLTQISLAKLMALNVSAITLLGTNSSVQLLMDGNGLTATESQLSNLHKDLFNPSYTVTLQVTNADLTMLLGSLNTTDFAAKLSAAGIDSLKPVAGSLSLTVDQANHLINVDHLSFSSGTFSLSDSANSVMSFAQVQSLVVQGGLTLQAGTKIDLSTLDTNLSSDLALKLINSGASFVNANGLSIQLNASTLVGNAQAVADTLASIHNAGLSFTLDKDAASAGGGVEISGGHVKLTGLTLSFEEAQQIIQGDLAHSVSFANTSVNLSGASLPSSADLGALFNAGATNFVVSGAISTAQAQSLLNVDSSVKVYATVNDHLTATQAMGMAARGITPTNVDFDIGYVKSYILDQQHKLTSPITVNVAFDDPTISATDFLNLINSGVKFSPGVGSVLIKDTDTSFVAGNTAVTNQLALVKAGLNISAGSAEISGATLSLANAQTLVAAHINKTEPVFGSVAIQLSSSDLNNSNLVPTLQALRVDTGSSVKLTFSPISGAISAQQFDTLHKAFPSAGFAQGTQLQLADANAIDIAVKEGLNNANFSFANFGINSVSLTPTSITYSQALGLKAEGISSVNAGVKLVLDAAAIPASYSANASASLKLALGQLSALGLTQVGVASEVGSLSALQVKDILGASSSITFAPGTQVNLAGTTTTLADATLYSNKGLTLQNLDTIGVSSISIGDALSLSAKGAHFADPGGSAVVVTGTSGATITLSQAQQVLAASNTGVSFSGFSSLKLSSADLQNLNTTKLAALSQANLLSFNITDSPSVAQLLSLAGTGISLSSNVTLVDKTITNVDSALSVINLGAKFASGTTLVASNAASLEKMLGINPNALPANLTGLDLASSQIAQLKLAGVSGITLSSGTLPGIVADAVASIGGINFSGVTLESTGAVYATKVAKYASLGISINPSQTIMAGDGTTLGANKINFGDAYLIASKGGKIAFDTLGDANHVVSVNLSSADGTSVSFAKAIAVIGSAMPSGAGAVPTSFQFLTAAGGSPSIALASGNSDLASVVTAAQSLHTAGFNSVITSQAAAGGVGTLSVSLGQAEALKTSGIGFVQPVSAANGDIVSLQLSAGNANLDSLITKLGNDSLPSGITYIKAGGASIAVDGSQFASINNHNLKFTSGDLVTVKLTPTEFSGLTPELITQMRTDNVDQVASSTGQLGLDITQAKALQSAGISLAANQQVSLIVNPASPFSGFTGTTTGFNGDTTLAKVAEDLKAFGVNTIKVGSLTSAGTLTLSVQEVEDITGIRPDPTTGVVTNLNLLKFSPLDTVGAQIVSGSGVSVQATTSDLNFLINNSASLYNAGVHLITAVPGSSLGLSVNQLSTLLGAGSLALTLDAGAQINLTIGNATDLAYVTSNASAIHAANVDTISLTAGVNQLTLAQAQSLAASSLTLTTPVPVALSASDALGLSVTQLRDLISEGVHTLNLSGAQLTTAQAQALLTKIEAATSYTSTTLGTSAAALSVTGAVVQTSSFGNEDAVYKGFGFRNLEGYVSSNTINLDQLTFGTSSVSVNAGVAGLAASTTLTTLAPTSASVVTITSGSSNSSITSAQLSQLNALSSGKLAFSGVTLKVSGSEAAALTPSAVTLAKSLGINTVSSVLSSGSWTVGEVQAVKAAGMLLSGSVSIASGSVSLADLQNLSSLGVTFGSAVQLSDASVSAGVAKKLTINLSNVLVSDSVVSVDDAIALAAKGMAFRSFAPGTTTVTKTTYVSGSPTVAQAEQLLGLSTATGFTPPSAANLISGFVAGTTISVSANSAIPLADALLLAPKLNLGTALISGNPTTTELSTLLKSDPAAFFVSGSTIPTGSGNVVVSYSDITNAKQAGLSFATPSGSGHVQLSLDSVSGSSTTLNGNLLSTVISNAALVASTGVSQLVASAPVTLTLTQAQGLSGLSFVSPPTVSTSPSVTLSVGSADLAYLTDTAVQTSLQSLGVNHLASAGPSITLTQAQFDSFKSLPLKFDTTSTVYVSLSPSASDTSGSALLASLDDVKIGGYVQGVVFGAGATLNEEQVKKMELSGLKIVGSPSISYSVTDPNQIAKLYSEGFNVSFGSASATQRVDLTGIDASSALSLAQNPGVGSITLSTGTNTLTVTQSQWSAFTANPTTDPLSKIHAETGALSFQVAGVSASSALAIASQGAVSSVLLAPNQNLTLSATQWGANTSQLAKISNLVSANVTVNGIAPDNSALMASLSGDVNVDKVVLSASEIATFDASLLSKTQLAKIYNPDGSASFHVPNSPSVLSVAGVTNVGAITYVNAASIASNSFKVSGTAEAGSAVKIYDGTNIVGTAIADSVTGSFTATINGSQLANISSPMQHLFKAVAVNSNQISSDILSSGLTITVDTVANTTVDVTPVYVSASGVAASTYTSSFTVPTGETVQVFRGSTDVTGQFSVSELGGVKTYTPVGQFNGEELTVKTTAATDVAGNVATTLERVIKIDNTAPTITLSGVGLSADTGTSASDFITKTAAQVVTGTLSAAPGVGETVQVSADGSTWVNATVTTSGGVTSFNASGVTLVGAVGGAATSVQVRVVDAAGNIGVAGSHSYTLDTVANTTVDVTPVYVSASGVAASTYTSSFTVPTGETVQVFRGSTDVTGQFSVSELGGVKTYTPVGQFNGEELTVKTTAATDVAGNVATTLERVIKIDNTAPTITLSGVGLSADTGTSASDFITKTAAQVVTGTLSAAPGVGETVQVSADGSTWVNATVTTSGGVTSFNASGVTLVGAVGGAATSVQVRVVDAAGNIGVAGSHSYTLDTVANTTVDVTPVYVSASGVAASTYTSSFTVPTGETVQVFRGSTDVTGQFSVSELGGVKTYTPVGQFNGEELTVKTTAATDVAGNVATTLERVIKIDNTAPTITLSGVGLSADTGTSASDFITKTAAQVVTGTLSAAPGVGETVQVSADGSTWVNATVTTSGGVTSFNASGVTLVGAVGGAATSVQVRVVDAAGNIGVAGSHSYSLDVIGPSATITVDDVTADNTMNLAESNALVAVTGTVGGDVKIGDTVTLTVNGNDYTGLVADGASGIKTYSINVPGSELAADTTVHASVTTRDLAGNPTTVSRDHSYAVDVIGPSATITVDGVTADNTMNLAESNALVAVTGTVGGDVKIGDTVTLTVNGNDYTGLVADGASGIKTYSINVPGSELAADTTVHASVTTRDLAGNPTTVSRDHSYAVDVIGPSATITVDGVTADNTMNLAESNALVAVTGTVGGDVKIGDTVTLTVNGNDYTGLVADGASGIKTYSINVPGSELAADTTVHASVTTRDLAGNPTTVSRDHSYAVDVIGPSATITVDGVTADNTMNLAESNALVAVTGTVGGDVKIGDTVTLTVNGNDYTGLVADGASGIKTYSINVPGSELAADTTVHASVTTRDLAGNPTTVSRDHSYAVDVIGPSATITVDGVTADNTMNLAESNALVAVTGTVGGDVKIGDTVTLTVNGNDYTGLVADGASGIKTYSINVPGSELAADTTVHASVTTRDLAGNPTTVSRDHSYAVDVIGPSATITVDGVTADNTMNLAESNALVAVTGTVGGDVKIGDTVTLTVNGNDYTGLVADGASGIKTYSINVPGSELAADTTVHASVTTRDLAGNPTTVSRDHSYAVDVIGPSATITVDGVTADNTMNLAESNALVAVTGTVGGDVKIGDTVTLTVNGNDYTGLVADGASGIKTYSINVPGSELAADTTVHASVTTRDLAGNPTTVSRDHSYAVDVIGPSATITVDGVTADNTMNLAESNALVAVTGTVGGDVKIGDTVTLTVNGNDYTGLVADGASGIKTYSINVPGSELAADTTVHASVTTRDLAGNPTTVSRDHSYAVDVIGPSATITVDGVTADNTMNLAESNALVAVTGTVGGDVKIGDTVTLTVNGNDYTGLVADGASGIKTYSINVPGSELAADTTVHASVTTRDLAGNPTTVSRDHSYAVDVIGPSATITVDGVTADNTMNLAESNALVAVTGTVGGDVKIGDTVTLTVNGNDYTGLVADGASGIKTYSINVPGSELAADTTVHASVTTRDLAGNPTTVSRDHSYAVDVIGPSATISLSSITNDNLLSGPELQSPVNLSGFIRGDFTEGDSVTVHVGKTELLTSLDVNGNFSVQVPAATLLDNSDRTITVDAVIRDLAGNEARVSSVPHFYAVDTDTNLIHLKGKAIDGYIEGGRAFFDANDDGILDDGEGYVTTDSQGNFDLTLAAGTDTTKGHIVVEGGVDTFTGQKLTGNLIALNGHTLVTPLTTLLALATEGPNAVKNLSISDVEGQFKIALGISPDVRLADYDPVLNMSSGDSNTRLIAEHLFKVQQAVFSVLQSSCSLLDGDATTKIVSASSALVNAILEEAVKSPLNWSLSAGKDPSVQDQFASKLKSNLSAITLQTVQSVLSDPLASDALLSDKVEAITGAINSVNESILTHYTGLAQNIIDAHNGDVIALNNLALAKSVAGLSQTHLLEVVTAGKAGSALTSLNEFAKNIENNIQTKVRIENADADGKLNVTLKDLIGENDIGIDVVNLSASNNNISIDFGDDQGTGPVLSNSNIPIFTAQRDGVESVSASDLNVTLNISNSNQLDEVAAASLGVSAAGIDNVQINLHHGPAKTPTEAPESFEHALDRLLSNHGATLKADVDRLRQAHLNVTTIDVGGANVDASVSINESQAGALINAGLHFASNDNITFAADGGVGGHGTHLHTSLKELSALGVDTVTMSGSGQVLSVDFGSFTNGDAHPGKNESGVTLNHVAFDKNWDVTLDVANLSQLDVAAQLAGGLKEDGIDNVQINLHHGPAKTPTEAPESFEHALDRLLSNHGATLKADVDRLRQAHLNVTTIDVGGANVDASVSINESQAGALINAGLHFASNDNITFAADGGVGGHGTHLHTSLKELSALGVDTVTMSGSGQVLSVDFGSFTNGDAHPGKNESGVTLNHVAFDKNWDVTLDVANLSQLDVAAQLAGGLKEDGIDNVQINLHHGPAKTPTEAPESFEHALDRLLSNHGATLKADVDRLRQAHLNVTTIDVGGANVDASVSINESQAGALINAGLHFASNDNITFAADGGVGGHGTHLHTSLKELSALGVDTVTMSGSGQVLSVDFGSFTNGDAHPGKNESGVTLNHVAFDKNWDVTLDVANLSQLDVAAQLAGGLKEDGIDNVQINLHHGPAKTPTEAPESFEHALDRLLSNHGATLKADVDRLRQAHLNVTTIDVGGANVDASVSINESQAGALINAGLHFASNDNITFAADGGVGGHGTHLHTSLKELSALGVDTVTMSGSGQVLSVDFGSFTNGDAHPGKNESGVTLNHVAFDKNWDVTLDVANLSQLDVAAQLAGGLKEDGIDNVQINLHHGPAKTPTEAPESFEHALDRLLSNHGATLKADVDRLRQAHLNVTTIDVGGANVDASVSINESQAGALINAGLHFASNDNITFAADGGVGGHGTHLHTSLKELSALGVDTVTMSGSGQVLSVDFGSFTNGDAHPGKNESGVTLNHVAFDKNWDVTLDVANLSQLDVAAQLAGGLKEDGIDNVQINLHHGPAKTPTEAPESFEHALDRLLSNHGATLKADVDRLRQAHLNVTTIDVGGANVDASVSINESQAGALINAGLHFASNDNITFAADGGVGGHGTHLHTSLKELSALGVDTVTMSGSGQVLSVDFGSFTNGDAHPGKNESGVTLNHVAFDKNWDVTLDVANLSQLDVAAQLAGGLKEDGIDNVQINLHHGPAKTPTEAPESFEHALDRLLSNHGATLKADVDRLRQAHLNVTTIDVGGANVDASVSINESQAGALINAGLHFASNDNITLDLSGLAVTDGHIDGTHLKNTLKNIHSLGVDSSPDHHLTNNLGIDTIDISGVGNLTNLNDLTHILSQSGISQFGIHSSEFETLNKDPNAHTVNDMKGSHLLQAFENPDWLTNDVKLKLEIDDTKASAHEFLTNAQQSDNLALNKIIQHGVDLLSKHADFANGATWETLINTLKEAGLGDVEIESKANVHIGDDLTAALYESGMLHALPDAHIVIDVASDTKLLSTSLKAMADLGVDQVNSSQAVFVKLGIAAGEISDMQDLFAAFGLDKPAAPEHQIFDSSKGAGLVLDSATADKLGIVPSIDEAKVSDLVNKLSKLGITEVDVVHTSSDGASNSFDVYKIEKPASAPVDQTPILTKVEVLGTHDDLSHAFDHDILDKNIKH